MSLHLSTLECRLLTRVMEPVSTSDTVGFVSRQVDCNRCSDIKGEEECEELVINKGPDDPGVINLCKKYTGHCREMQKQELFDIGDCSICSNILQSDSLGL